MTPGPAQIPLQLFMHDLAASSDIGSLSLAALLTETAAIILRSNQGSQNDTRSERLLSSFPGSNLAKEIAKFVQKGGPHSLQAADLVCFLRLLDEFWSEAFPALTESISEVLRAGIQAIPEDPDEIERIGNELFAYEIEIHSVSEWRSDTYLQIVGAFLILASGSLQSYRDCNKQEALIQGMTVLRTTAVATIVQMAKLIQANGAAPSKDDLLTAFSLTLQVEASFQEIDSDPGMQI